MYAIIEPVPAYPSPAVKLLISAAQVIPGNSALFQWSLLSANGATVGSNSINLEGAAYAAWGADDEYLYRYSAESLGLVIVEIVPDVAAPGLPAVAPADAAVAPADAPVVSDEAPAAGGTND